MLDSPAHVVEVVPQVKTKNAYNGWDLADGEPILVPCNVQTVTAEEMQVLGGTLTGTLMRCIGRGPWPGGVHSRIRWAGAEWDQEGDARVYSQSPRTAHFDAIIRRRSSEVK